jgi:hypothetical protein
MVTLEKGGSASTPVVRSRMVAEREEPKSF